MKLASWDECKECNNALEITPDKAKARSLIGTAEERKKFAKESGMKEKNANFIFETLYTSLIEILHAYL